MNIAIGIKTLIRSGMFRFNAHKREKTSLEKEKMKNEQTKRFALKEINGNREHK